MKVKHIMARKDSYFKFKKDEKECGSSSDGDDDSSGKRARQCDFKVLHEVSG